MGSAEDSEDDEDEDEDNEDEDIDEEDEGENEKAPKWPRIEKEKTKAEEDENFEEEEKELEAEEGSEGRVGKDLIVTDEEADNRTKPRQAIRIGDRGIVIKRSHLSYIYNYFLAVLVVFLLFLSWTQFGLEFTLFPQVLGQYLKTAIVLGFIVVIVVLLEEPIVENMIRHYLITNTEVMKIDGVLKKTKVMIPYQSIADMEFNRSVLGGLLNFGDVNVVGFKTNILMKGVRDPELVYRIINNKITLTRSGKKTPTKQSIIYENEKTKKTMEKKKDWRSQERELGKKVRKK